MQEVKCSIIGHRKIEESNKVTLLTKRKIFMFITNYNVNTFLFGSRSDFNSICYEIITNIKKTYPNIKRICYSCKNEYVICSEKEKTQLESMLRKVIHKETSLMIFEEEFEFKSKYTAGKTSYIARNKAMIDDSDYCLFYFDENYKPPTYRYANATKQTNSGTKIAYNYARQKNKKIVNICDLLDI